MNTNKKYDAIIFDLDGTLCDLSLAMAYAYNLVYKKFNLNKSVSVQFARTLASLPYTEYKNALLDGVPEELHASMVPLFTDYANECCQNFSDFTLYPDIPEGIEKLAQQYQLFIVSNCGTNYLSLFLEKSSIGKYFQDALCYGHNHLHKSENITQIIERNNLQAPCYVGDSPSDEIATQEAKIDFYFAAYGACYKDTASDNIRFNSFADLIAYFCQKEN